ncbi:MAG: ABC transporter permease [Oscillospiraceae bacterium]|nr:ABC transporter permease [Oscillospiraceae bacterium]
MFLKSALSFAKLEYRALRFYPSNFALAVVQSFVTVGIWFFVSLFLKDYAAASLSEYGGDFISYMVIGVVFFQNSSTILTLPYQSLNTAFWDKRLEIYNSSYYGIWAFISGRFIWNFFYQLIIQIGVMAAAVFFAGVKINAALPVFPLILYYLCFVFTCLGLGLIGSSTFFNLEVKQGREPFTWAVDILARIFSGIYYPLAILPIGIRFVSRIVPHTYALEGLRLIMMEGYGLGNSIVRNDLFVMLGFAVFSMLLGIIALRRALDRACKGNGVGMVV